MFKFNIYIVIGYLFFSSCLSFVSSIHKKPKIEKDFELYSKEVMDSLYKRFGKYIYLSDTIDYSNFRFVNVFSFDSTRVIWYKLEVKYNTYSEKDIQDLTILLKKKDKDSFGIVYKQERNMQSSKEITYVMQIAEGMRGLGYYFAYYDMEIISDRKIKLVMNKYQRFNKRAHLDPYSLEILNKELIFTPIKIK